MKLGIPQATPHLHDSGDSEHDPLDSSLCGTDFVFIRLAYGLYSRDVHDCRMNCGVEVGTVSGVRKTSRLLMLPKPLVPSCPTALGHLAC